MRYRSSILGSKGRRSETKGRSADCSRRIELEVGRLGDGDDRRRDESFETELLLLRMKDADATELAGGVSLLDMPYEFFFQQDEDGDTQLHNSIMMNHSDAARWLIELAPESWLLDVVNDDSQSALHVAVLCKRPELVRRLVLAGADLELRTRDGNSALHLACLSGDLDCARAILRPLGHPDDEMLCGCNNNGRTSFVSGDGNATTRYDLELKNYVGKTCLHIAASRNDAELVDLLLRSGANPCSRDGLSGSTALHMAVQNDCRKVARLLIKADRASCFERVDYSGCTAHQLALELGRRDLAQEMRLESRRSSGLGSHHQCLKLDPKEDLLSMQVAAFARMSFG